MQVIQNARQTGKTTKAIQLVADRNGYIVVKDGIEARRVFEQARDLGITINYPVTFSDILQAGIFFKGRKPEDKRVVIDNADLFLQQLLKEVQIEAITVTKETKRK